MKENPSGLTVSRCPWVLAIAGLILHSAVLSIAAPVAIPLKVNVQASEMVSFTAAYRSPDSTASATTLRIITRPLHGDLSIYDSTYKIGFTWHGAPTINSQTLSAFRYVPYAGFTGKDSFTWSIQNASGTSNTASCNIIVHPPEPGSMTVLIIVNDALLPKISAEATRLAADIASEGFSARIVPWPSAKSASATDNINLKALRDTLLNEYEAPGRYLAGAILLGKMPVFLETRYKQDDRALWCMSSWLPDIDSLTRGFFGRTVAHIWVSRICALDINWAPLPYGDEATLMKRALAANHDFRTGASRFESVASYFAEYAGSSSPTPHYFSSNPTVLSLLRQVWAGASLIPFEFVVKGELAAYRPCIAYSEYDGHGTDANIGHDIKAPAVFSYSVPFRFYTVSACHSGILGGITNVHLFTRNGGNVLSVSSTDYMYAKVREPAGEVESKLSVADTSSVKTRMRSLLKAGERWGRAWQRSGMPLIYTSFLGDLTLKADPWPSNRPPSISSFTPDSLSGISPLSVNLRCSAVDSDGTLDHFDWYTEGFGYGQIDPVVSAASQDSLRHVYTKPYHYRVQVNAVDNFKAWDYKAVNIFVAPNPSETLRVNCYSPQPYHNEYHEMVDDSGRLWLHDQVYVPGTWGDYTTCCPGNSLKAHRGIADRVVTGSSPYNTCMYSNDSSMVLGYRVPLPNGRYTLKLGFADIVPSSGSNALDISTEGVLFRQGFSPKLLVGAGRPCQIDTVVNLADNELEFNIRTTTQTGGNRPFINWFVVAPVNPLDAVSRPPAAVGRPFFVSPNPFSGLSVFRIGLPEGAVQELRIFDLSGRLVADLSPMLKNRKPVVEWNGRAMDGRPLASGVYRCRLLVDGKIRVRSMTLVK